MQHYYISIHALREEGDLVLPDKDDRDKISIHALREEGDICQLGYQNAQLVFLSTPSARRATKDREPERDRLEISIHALREEGDCCGWRNPSTSALFLSTPSARRATLIVGDVNIQFPISIHALREEGDGSLSPYTLIILHFYPRPPRGGRRNLLDSSVHLCEFLSTPSARRATLY